MLINIRELIKQALVGLVAPFAALWPIIVGLAEKLNVDISAGKGAIFAALGAAGAAALAAAWNFLTQLWDGARGFFPAAPEAIEAVKIAKDKTEEALKLLRG